MKEQIKRIYQMMLDDAEETDPGKKVFKLTDKDLLTLINSYGEFFIPKQIRSTERDASQAPKTLGYDTNN